MSKPTERDKAIKRLTSSLSKSQLSDLVMVIQTADVQGDYHWNGDDSVWEDDVQRTLNSLAREFEDRTNE